MQCFLKTHESPMIIQNGFNHSFNMKTTVRYVEQSFLKIERHNVINCLKKCPFYELNKSFNLHFRLKTSVLRIKHSSDYYLPKETIGSLKSGTINVKSRSLRSILVVAQYVRGFHRWSPADFCEVLGSSGLGVVELASSAWSYAIHEWI